VNLRLRQAALDGGRNLAWDISTVDTAGFSTWPSLAYSPSGQITVAYFSSDRSALRYARRNPDGTWSATNVADANGDCAPSLNYRFNQPAISYASTTYPGGDTANPLKTMNYALDRGPGDALNWSINTFSTSGGRDSSLGFDSSRNPVISYFNKDGGLSWTRGASHATTWVGSAVDGKGNGSFNSLAMAPSGHPAIAYYATAADGKPSQIKYAEYDGTHWTKQAVGEGAGWVTLTFTRNGEPAIVYTRTKGTASDVVFAVRRQGTWKTEVVAADADSPSIAVHVTGLIGVSYHARGRAAIMYAINAGSGWSHFLVQETGKDQTGAMVGDFTLTSMAYSANGQPAIAYYDRGNGTIKVALGSQFSTEPRKSGILSALRNLFGRATTR
jgi:hypothetical protein